MTPVKIAFASLFAFSAYAAVQAQEVSSTPDLSRFVTTDQLNTAAATNLAAMQATTPQFIANAAYLTKASILSDYPCNTATLGKLAHVSDLWGGVATTMVCESNGASFYWRPQRTDYASTLAQTTGNITLVPLETPPVVYLSTATGNINLTPSTTNVWPGAQFRVYAPPTLSLYGVNINGLVGGGTLPIAQGSDKVLTYTPSGWKGN